MKYAVLFLTLFLAFSCSKEEQIPEDVFAAVKFYMEKNRFEEALTRVKSEDLGKPEMKTLLTNVHYNYGMYLKYMAEDMQMRPRMVGALSHLRRAQQLNPDIENIQAEIQQIEEVYRSLGREVPTDVAK